MGQVWVAENIDLDAHVALKLLRAGQRADAADRLKREARVLARLEHPAIVRVLDSGRTDQGTPYLVTELLHGETLADAMWRHRRVGTVRAVQLLLPVLEGLSVAHERGIVHRDLKPANIFLARLASGRLQPKILDFGIAAIRQDIDVRTTAEGVLLGSPAYMSPEQARGATVDTRADLWAMSVILYEMVIGESPFEGTNHHAVLRAIVESEPRSFAERGLDDLPLWAAIKRGLAKDVQNRWPTATLLGRALAEWLVARGITEDATRASVHSTWLVPESCRSVSSYPPVVLGASSPASREADTVAGTPTPTPMPATEAPSSPGTGRHWEVAVRRTRHGSSSALLWLAAGVLAGAVGALLYAATLGAPVQTTSAAAPPPERGLPTAPHAEARAPLAAPAPSTSARPPTTEARPVTHPTEP